MGAAELLDYDQERLRGLVLEEGGPTSHVAIVARALGIAAVGQVEEAVSLAESGDPVIVDGDIAEVHLRPPAEIEIAYADKVRFRAKRQEQYRRLRDEPAVTRDGVEIAGVVAPSFLDTSIPAGPHVYTVYADDGEEVLAKVHERGLEPVAALVRRSSLEDVFLRLTGRSLVD
jgi:hypothetical protein